MDLSLPVAESPLNGTLAVPGDKSLAHRAALFAAVAEGDSEIHNYPDSGVTRAMRGALASLGVDSSWSDGVLRVSGRGFRPFPNVGATAFCGNSATTIRLLAGVLAGTGSEAVLDGSEGLRRRPMDRVVDPLVAMGARVAGTPGVAADGRAVACSPLCFGKAALKAVDYALPVASAQVLSCLQLAALGADGESHFIVPGPVRDHTVRMLSAMGADIRQMGLESFVRPLARPLTPLFGALPGDASSAAFLFAAAAIVPGSSVTVTGVGVNPTRTGMLDILSRMGVKVSYANAREVLGEPVADVTVEAAPLNGVVVDGDLVVRAIDEFPALAVVGAFAQGALIVREARELRYKETDRIAAIVAQLRALGAHVDEFPDGFCVHGGTLTGGRAHAHGDHRLAMSMALCGLRAPVVVEGAEILRESYPTFEPSVLSLMVRPR